MTGADELPESDPTKQESVSFTPEVLDRSAMAIPLLRILQEKGKEEDLAAGNGRDYVPDLVPVIVDLNFGYRVAGTRHGSGLAGWSPRRRPRHATSPRVRA